MASTPPPLPSSSEDSDFDDDDFGCFSSAPPIKTPVSAIMAVEHSADNLKQTKQIAEIDRSDTSIEAEKEKRSENFHEAHTEVKSDYEDILPTENHDSYQSENLDLSSPTFQSVSDNVSCKVEEIQNDLNLGSLQHEEIISESTKDVDTSDNNLDDKKEDDRLSPFEDKNNSKAEETKEILEAQVEVSHYDKEEEDNGNGTKLNQNKDDDHANSLIVENNSCTATEFGDDTEEKEDNLTEDDFADWSGAQGLNCSLNTNENVDDIDTADKKDEASENCSLDDNSDHSENANVESNVDENNFSSSSHIAEDIPFQTAVTSASGHSDNSDCDFGAFDTNKDAMSSSDCNDDVPEPEESSQHRISDSSSPQGQLGNDGESSGPHHDIIDDQDEDDFGDFADFSSHQGFENTRKKDDISPIHFRTSTADQDDENSAGNKSNDSSNVATPDVTRDQDLSNIDGEVNSNSNSIKDEKIDDDDDDDDDWGFKSADVAVDKNNFNDQSGGPNNDDDWASFNESPSVVVSSSNIKDDDDAAADDDFDDFSSSTTQTAFPPQSEPSVLTAQTGSSKVEKVFFMCFPSISPATTGHSVGLVSDQSCDTSTGLPSEDNNEVDDLGSVIEMGLKATPHAKEETWTIVKELRNKDPVVGTWGRLKDVNSCHALVYGWNTSHCCQEVFSTLHIDTKNVLFSQKKQAVPFYASGLGILEPIRGGPNPTEKTQQPAQPNLLDTAKNEEESKKVLDIPPVDFDWGSSGLTNPLKVFKADSFNNGLSSLDSFTDVLQKNMEPTKELSAEAKSILAKMPNLNFMRSNVLMFPIKD